MEEIFQYEKQLNILFEQETERLLILGYTQKEIDALDDALEYISFPIVAANYENPSPYKGELDT